MKTPPETFIELAKTLWQAGYQGDKQGRPINRDKPLIPSAIAEAMELPLGVAVQVNHLLVVWSLGAAPFGQWDRV
jgi:hypothetical protein